MTNVDSKNYAVNLQLFLLVGLGLSLSYWFWRLLHGKVSHDPKPRDSKSDDSAQQTDKFSSDVSVVKLAALQQGLSDRDLSSLEALSTAITDRKKVLSALERKGRMDSAIAKRRRDSLVELIDIKDQLAQYDNLILARLLPKNAENLHQQETEMVLFQGFYPGYQLPPAGAERSLACLLASLECLASAKRTFISGQQQKIALAPFVAVCYDQLQRRLQLEHSNSEKLKLLLMQSRQLAESNRWQAAYQALRPMLKEFQVFDIQKLFLLVEDARETGRKIKNQDIVLLLGPTGVGKSTTLHYLAGSKMEKVKLKGLTHIKPKSGTVGHAVLRAVTTSPEARSETQRLTAVPVSYVDPIEEKLQTLIVCDTPGFEDTAGPEVDIANSVGVVQTIRQCHSVKLVVLISQKGIGDRGQGLKKFILLLTKLMPNVLDHSRSFYYLFTKYTSQEALQLPAFFQSIYMNRTSSEKQDLLFSGLLLQLIKQTKKGVSIVLPLQTNREELLSELAEIGSIRHPSEVFHSSFSANSEAILKEQTNRHHVDILTALKRDDTALVEYKLRELKLCNDFLKCSFLQEIYRKSRSAVGDYFNTIYKIAVTRLERGFLLSQRFQLTDLFFLLQQEELLSVTNLFQKYELKLDYQQPAAIKKIALHLAKQAVECTDPNVLFKQKIIQCDNLLLLVGYYKELRSTYGKLTLRLELKLEKLFSDIKKSIDKNALASTKGLLADFETILHTAKQHLDSKDWQAKFSLVNNYLLSHQRMAYRKLLESLHKPEVSAAEVKKYNQVFSSLEEAAGALVIYNWLDIAKLGRLRQETAEQVITQVKKEFIKAALLLEETKVDFEQLRSSLQLISSLRNIILVKAATEADFYELIEASASAAYQLVNSIAVVLKQFIQKPSDKQIQQIKQLFETLEKASHLSVYKATFSHDLATKLGELFSNYVDSVVQKISQCELDGKCFLAKAELFLRLDLPKAYQKIFKLGKEKIKTALVDKVKSYTVDLKEKFKLSNIDKLLSQQQVIEFIDFSLLEHSLSEAKALCGIVVLAPVADIMEKTVSEYLQILVLKIEAILEEAVGTIEARNMEQLSVACQQLRYFITLTQLIKQYPAVFTFFSSPRAGMLVGKKYQERLTQIYIGLQRELRLIFSDESTFFHMEKMLGLTRMLVELGEPFSTSDYRSLFKQYHSLYYNKLRSIPKKVTQLLEQFHFNSIAFMLSSLRKATDPICRKTIDDCKSVINNWLRQQLENIRISCLFVSDGPETKMMLEEDAIKKLQEMQQHLAPLIDDALKDSVKKELADIESEITMRFGLQLRTIAASIRNNDFNKADVFISQLAGATARFQKRLVSNDKLKDIINRIKQKKLQLDDALKTLPERYRIMKSEDFIYYQPAQVFSNLEKLARRKSEYDSIRVQFYEMLKARIEQLFLHCDFLMQKEQLVKATAALRKNKAILQSCPLSLQLLFNEDLQQYTRWLETTKSKLRYATTFPVSTVPKNKKIASNQQDKIENEHLIPAKTTNSKKYSMPKYPALKKLHEELKKNWEMLNPVYVASLLNRLSDLSINEQVFAADIIHLSLKKCLELFKNCQLKSQFGIQEISQVFNALPKLPIDWAKYGELKDLLLNHINFLAKRNCFNARDASTILNSMSKLNANLIKHEALLGKLIKSFSSSNVSKVDLNTLNQLWQFCVFANARKANVNDIAKIFPIVNKVIKERKREKITPSLYQKKIYNFLKELLDPRAVRQLIMQYPVGSYSLDIAFPGKKLNIEIDTPYHYRGTTLMRIYKFRDFILQSYENWEIIRIPHFEWENIANNPQTQADFLLNKLSTHPELLSKVALNRLQLIRQHASSKAMYTTGLFKQTKKINFGSCGRSAKNQDFKIEKMESPRSSGNGMDQGCPILND